jgi:hypothetical protein
VEDPESAPGGEDALGYHLADARHLMPHLGPGQGREGRRIHVAVREVPQEIASGADPEPSECFGPPLSDALEKLNRGIETGTGRSGASRHPL